jgi:hypothetical protein
MEAKQPKIKNGPEWQIQQAIMKKLFSLGWHVEHLHASVYLTGLPDLFATRMCANKVGIQRFIEVKDPKRRGNIFTPAQLKKFPILCKNGSPVWVLTSDSDDEIAKLFKPYNWYVYLQCMR